MFDIKYLFSTYFYHSYRLLKRKNITLLSTKKTIILNKSCYCDIVNCNVIVSAFKCFTFLPIVSFSNVKEYDRT